MASTTGRRRAARRKARQVSRAGVWERGKLWFVGAGALGVVGLIFVLILTLSGVETTDGEVIVPDSLPSVGEAVSPVSAPSVLDFPVSLYQGEDVLGSRQLSFGSLLGDQPIVLNHWASDSVPCSAEMPEFQRVYEAYKGKVLFFGLDIGRFSGFGGPDESARELGRLGVTYPAAPVPDVETLAALEVRALPSTDFITPDGKFLRRWTGSLSEKRLTELVEELLDAS